MMWQASSFKGSFLSRFRAFWWKINSWSCCLPWKKKNSLMWSWTVSFLWVHTQLFSSRAQHSYFKHTGPSLLMGVMHKRVAGLCSETNDRPDLFSLPGIRHKKGGFTKVGSFLIKVPRTADWGEERGREIRLYNSETGWLCVLIFVFPLHAG